MIQELIANMKLSTTQGFVGVGLIVFYFLLILRTAIMRIRRGDHMRH